MSLTKPELRATIRRSRRELRARLGEPGWHERASELADTVTDHPLIRLAATRGEIVASYESVFNEPPTSELNDRLAYLGAKVALPVTEFAGKELAVMSWRTHHEDPTRLLAPDLQTLIGLGCTVMLVPALAVTEQGVRLGRGGGYYDRSLAALSPSTRKQVRVIGLVGPDEVLDSLPTEPHDQLLDGFLRG